jgi:hypothetical protein
MVLVDQGHLGGGIDSFDSAGDFGAQGNSAHDDNTICHFFTSYGVESLWLLAISCGVSRMFLSTIQKK